LEPDRTLATRHLSGCKINKERLSVTLCVNANSSHKLDPLVIGKYQRPHCFKNIRIQNMPMKNASASTLANTSANTYQENSAHDNLVDTLQALRLSYPMRVKEFLNISEDVVYEAPEDDQIIDEL
ncbi:1810_t:CDS:2, partial [Dentiscutata heterogama]